MKDSTGQVAMPPTKQLISLGYGHRLLKAVQIPYIHKKLSIHPVAMTADLLMDFRSFLYDKSQFVDKYPILYEDIGKRELPTKRRSRNTVATKMKISGLSLQRGIHCPSSYRYPPLSRRDENNLCSPVCVRFPNQRFQETFPRQCPRQS